MCTAFNADFDGDQMAIHIPLSTEACSESWSIMWSPFQILSPANGQPSILPTQDMVLGCYYLTTTTSQNFSRSFLFSQKLFFHNKKERQSAIFSFPKRVGYLFDTLTGSLRAYDQGILSIHQNVWVFLNSPVVNSSFREEDVEEVRITPYGATAEFYLSFQCRFDCKGVNFTKAVRTTPGRTLFNIALNVQLET